MQPVEPVSQCRELQLQITESRSSLGLALGLLSSRLQVPPGQFSSTLHFHSAPARSLIYSHPRSRSSPLG